MSTDTLSLIASTTIQISNDQTYVVVILIFIATILMIDFVRRFVMPGRR